MTLTREPPLVTTRSRPLLGRGLVAASMAIALLLTVATVAGLFFDAYGEETEFAANGYRGADLVSLVLALPLLVASCVAAARGSFRGQLLWLGSIAYCVYQYAYVFAYRWNELFPLHLLLFSLSLFTLVVGLLQVRWSDVADRFDAGLPRRGIALVLWVLAAGLGIMETLQMSVGLISGRRPTSSSSPATRPPRCTSSTSASWSRSCSWPGSGCDRASLGGTWPHRSCSSRV